MSKKQREKVEDEVRYHRAQMKQQTVERSPEPQVGSSDQPASSYGVGGYSSYGGEMSPYTPSGYGFTPTPHNMGGYDITGTDYSQPLVDSTTPTAAFDPRQTPIEPMSDSNLLSPVVSAGKLCIQSDSRFFLPHFIRSLLYHYYHS